MDFFQNEIQISDFAHPGPCSVHFKLVHTMKGMLSRLYREGIKVASRPAKSLNVIKRDYSWTGRSQEGARAWTATGSIAVIASTCALGYLATDLLEPRVAYAEAPSSAKEFSPPERKDLPIFKKEEVKKHGKDSKTIWVTYKSGVYDITEFQKLHPGGDKILLAAGSAVDPYWSLYAQHQTKEVMEILEDYRIGSLDPKDVEAAKAVDASDPFRNDPERHPALIVNQQRPFNAEAPGELIMDYFRTPNELFFVRHHMPVPQIDPKEHRLTVEGVGVKRPINLSVDELKNNYRPVSITSAIQCAGNRRADMNKYKKTQGLAWNGTAISNAQWTGVRLRDLLILAGVDPNDSKIKHVHLEGADSDSTGQSYGASIPFEKAMSPEVIIAYSMNGEDIPRDHGAPLRCIVPGVVGARQVKWLKTVRLSDVESPSHWQQKDYKAFPPNVGPGDELDWKSVPAIQDYPVQSAFCIPAPNTKVKRDSETVDVAGYAWSGGGRGIIRVEVSGDGGKTWQSAELEQDPEQDLDHMWAWTLFRANIKIPEGVEKMELVVKATDRAHNTQPEGASGIWNVRGLIHNAWHRVTVQIVD
ncbi:hypothetical protein V3C99_007944 [Haemonchus contortus]